MPGITSPAFFVHFPMHPGATCDLDGIFSRGPTVWPSLTCLCPFWPVAPALQMHQVRAAGLACELRDGERDEKVTIGRSAIQASQIASERSGHEMPGIVKHSDSQLVVANAAPACDRHRSHAEHKPAWHKLPFWEQTASPDWLVRKKRKLTIAGQIVPHGTLKSNTKNRLSKVDPEERRRSLARQIADALARMTSSEEEVTSKEE